MGTLFALSAAASWSIAVIFFKLAGDSIHPLVLNIFRNLIAFVLFLITAFFFAEQNIFLLNHREWVLLTVSALLGITLGDVLFISALKRIGVISQAIIDCLYSPFVMLLAFLFYQETLSLLGMIGAFLVISAVFVSSLKKEKNIAGRKNLIIGLIYGALAQFCMGLSVVMIRDLLRKDDVLIIMTFRLFIGSLSLLLIGILMGYKKQIVASFKPHPHFSNSLIASFVGSYLATFFWFLGFKYILAAKAAIYNQMGSIFMIVLATIFLKEKFTPEKAFAVILGVSGALLVGIS